MANESKDLRYRNQYFPDAERLVFHTQDKGFVPLPIILRKLMRFLSTPEWRVLTYLQLRASKYGICYPTMDEIVHELGLANKKNLLPYLQSLEEKQFISSVAAVGKQFFLLHDPRVPIKHLVKENVIKLTDLFEINELLKDLGQTEISLDATSKAESTTVGVTDEEVVKR